MNPKIIGYYDSPNQTKPTYNPGPKDICPICYKPLNYPENEVTTTSLMLDSPRLRSIFYRAHKFCYREFLDEDGRNELDGQIIDTEINKNELINPSESEKP